MPLGNPVYGIMACFPGLGGQGQDYVMVEVLSAIVSLTY